MRLIRFPFSSRFRTGLLVAAACLLMLGVQSPRAVAFDVTLVWGANTEPDLAGYRAYVREEGELFDYDRPEWEGTETTCTIEDLDEDTHYYFVVRAFDTLGNESLDSNEIGLPLLLLSPLQESEPSGAPIFQWTPGPYDLYFFCTLFPYSDVGYRYAWIWLHEDSLVMPASWWNRIEPGHLCFWGVTGIDTATGHWEHPGYKEFTKIE